MGNLYDYFAAADDTAAAALFTDGPGSDPFGTVGLKGVDPDLLLGTIEARLSGLPPEEVETDPRFTRLLSDPGHESSWLVTLTDRLRDSLATASAARLHDAAAAWASSEGEPAEQAALTADFLDRLAALSRHARKKRYGLYCRMSL
ncbi:hypothetical protein [Streptomyces nodosus]|uniref:Uncharacterized protein n=1 Tax=Streptomyces nodosus TaxID=40318 RepID=A0A0B5DFF8_9ACTN|nr:hypothetical protein [Streptomyces nodosus]AJE39156.1 hypothetical protein SNOD_03240 [Streptomyces nodosus]MBB4790038.1 hypothetical protein [Streptomyces nodosus]QEV37757.1 hypothetical protein CP978_03635 [Streptomyces nodosus]